MRRSMDLGAATFSNLPPLAPDDEELLVEVEIFELARWSEEKRDWGSTYPAFLQATDPSRFCSRRLQPVLDSSTVDDTSSRPPNDTPCLDGWRWVDGWRRDQDLQKWSSSGGTHKMCDAEGWLYSSDCMELSRMILNRSLPADAPATYPYLDPHAANLPTRPLPVRWRRWVRTRRRIGSDGEGAARPLSTAPGVSCGGHERNQEVSEGAIVQEGWLARYDEAEDRWTAHWAVLVRNRSDDDAEGGGVEGGGGCTLLYSFSMDSVDCALSCPSHSLRTTLHPAIPRALALTIGAAQLFCCFGIGSSSIGDGVLHCAGSEVERSRWVAALAMASTHTDAGDGGASSASSTLDEASARALALPGASREPGRLVVLILGANNLVATERNGSTDGYVKGTLKGAKRTQTAKTAVVRGTVSPRWDSELVFKDVWSEEAQLLLHVKGARRPPVHPPPGPLWTPSAPLGPH